MRSRKTIIRYLMGVSISLVFLYLIIFSIGVYRVWSYESELKKEHTDIKNAVEPFMDKLEVGQSEDILYDFTYAKRYHEGSGWSVWYYDLIEESSSVSNRMCKSYFIKVNSGIITSVEEGYSMIHGDRFESALFFYPRVAFTGISGVEY